MKTPTTKLVSTFNDSAGKSLLSDTRITQFEILMRHGGLSDDEKQEVADVMLYKCFGKTMESIAHSTHTVYSSHEEIKRALAVFASAEVTPFLSAKVSEDIAEMALNVALGEQNTEKPENVHISYFKPVTEYKREVAKTLLKAADDFKEIRDRTLDKASLVSTGHPVEPMRKLTIGNKQP